MKSMMSMITIIVVLVTTIGCGRSNMNAVEALQEEQLSFLETVEMHKVEVDSEKVNQIEEIEQTPVFSKNELIEYETYSSLVNVDSLETEVPLLDEQGKKIRSSVGLCNGFEKTYQRTEKNCEKKDMKLIFPNDLIVKNRITDYE